MVIRPATLTKSLWPRLNWALLFGVAGSLDALSTLLFVMNDSGSEGNPLMLHLLHRSPLLFLFVKGVGQAAIGYALPKYARVLFYSQMAIVMWNLLVRAVC